MSERRQQPRHPVRLLVQHQSLPDEHPEIDYATDMSIGGIFISSKRVVTPKTTVHVQFAPARDSRLVSTFMRVTHVTPTGFGGQFVSLDHDAASLIASTLGSFTPPPAAPAMRSSSAV